MAINLDPNALEARLAGDYGQAQKRVNEFSTAVGIDEPRGTRKEQFMAKGVRIKGKLIGQAELAEIDSNLKNLVDDLARTAGFTNMQEEAAYKLEQQKGFNKFREELLQKGLYLEQQMKESMIDTQTSMAIQNQFMGVAKAAGFAFAMKGMGDTTNADKMAMHEQGLQQGNMADLRMSQDAYFSNY